MGARLAKARDWTRATQAVTSWSIRFERDGRRCRIRRRERWRGKRGRKRRREFTEHGPRPFKGASEIYRFEMVHLEDSCASCGLRANQVEGRDNILMPSEIITFASQVTVRRNLLPRKRTLILTDYPRLLCVRESGHKVTMKSEVFLGRPQGDPTRAVFVKSQADSPRSFVVKTVSSLSFLSSRIAPDRSRFRIQTQRSFKYEEPSGMAMRWVSELGDAHTQALQSPNT